MDDFPDSQTVVDSALPGGYRLANYVIDCKLGQGGFGITYLAHETATDRVVVIKENFPHECSVRNTASLLVGASGEDRRDVYQWALKRFLDEAKVLIRLSHPCIVPVLSAFKAQGTAYYVMPLVRGAELDAAAPAPDKIDEAWLKPVLQQLLLALDYLHGEGMLHRDIKPSNIVLREDGTPVLIDFGTSREADSTHTLTRIGTKGYCPLEQFLSRGKNGAWTDLYSLGATCYRLITGEPPQDAFDRLEDDEVVRLAESDDLKKRFSVGFLSAIDKSLFMTRNERWQSAREWLNELGPVPVQQPIFVDANPIRKREKAGAKNKVSAQGQSFNIGWAVCFALVAALSSLAGGAILLGILAAIRGIIRGAKVGKIWRNVLISIGSVLGLWVFATLLFVVLADISDSLFFVYTIPGALALGGYAAFYQYLKGECGKRIALFAFLGIIGGGMFGYAYTEMLVNFYTELVPGEDAMLRFMGAICMSLIAAPVCALIGGFGKKLTAKG